MKDQMPTESSTLCIVLGFGKRQDVFDRHLPLWERHGFDMVIGCPSDDPLDARGHDRVFTGLSSYTGIEAVKRLRYVLSKYNNQWESNHLLIFEYDSICLLDKPQMSAGFHGIFQANQDPWHFVTPCYLNCPWIIDSLSATKMSMTAEEYPDLTEQGQDDRYLSALAWFSGVPLIGHKEGGFARNTIQPGDYLAMTEAIKGGVKWIHGIKDGQTLEVIKGLVPNLP